MSAVMLCLDGMAWMAKIPAAASASQSERVSFFMGFLLEFSCTSASQLGLRYVNCDEFAFHDIRPVLNGEIGLKSWNVLLVMVPPRLAPGLSRYCL
jgi:hypothetical protein